MEKTEKKFSCTDEAIEKTEKKFSCIDEAIKLVPIFEFFWGGFSGGFA